MRAESRLAVASALAPLAVLLVVVAGVSATVASTDDGANTSAPAPTGSPTGSAEPTAPPEAPEGTQRVVAFQGTTSFLVPDTEDWQVRTGASVGYQTEDGEQLVAVSSPAELDSGWCDAEESSSRAFVGFTRSNGGADATTQDAARATVLRWSQVLRDGVGEATEPTVVPVRLEDGTAAWAGTVTVSGAQTDSECAAPGIEVRAVTAPAEDGTTAVVLVRDVRADGSDLPGALDAAGADEIVRSVLP